MSTLAYAALTTRRDLAQAGHSTSDNPPGIRTYVDAFAALVPAEVLALHSTILAIVSHTTSAKDASKVASGEASNAMVTIDDPILLGYAFIGLVALSVALYVGPRLLDHKLDRLDFFRALIPPLALLGWMLLQRPSAIDAFALTWLKDDVRTVFAIFLAVVLGLTASWLAYKADQK